MRKLKTAHLQLTIVKMSVLWHPFKKTMLVGTFFSQICLLWSLNFQEDLTKYYAVLGESFLRDYHQLLDSKPEKVHMFYGPDSVLYRDGICRTGQMSIGTYISSLGISRCVNRIFARTAVPTVDRCILLQVNFEDVILFGYWNNFSSGSWRCFVKRPAFPTFCSELHSSPKKRSGQDILCSERHFAFCGRNLEPAGGRFDSPATQFADS